MSSKQIIEKLKKSPMITLTRRKKKSIIDFDGSFNDGGQSSGDEDDEAFRSFSMPPNQGSSVDPPPAIDPLLGSSVDPPGFESSVDDLAAGGDDNGGGAKLSSNQSFAKRMVAGTERTNRTNLDDNVLSKEVPQTEKGTLYFCNLLFNTIQNLNGHIATWRLINDEFSVKIGENLHGDILSTIGSANLIISGKLKQFRQLIEQCEGKATPTGTAPPTNMDLQGFWDVIYMQVLKIYAEFRKLTLIKENDFKPLPFKSPKPITRKPRVGPKKPKASVAAAVKKPAAKSKFREFLIKKRSADDISEPAEVKRPVVEVTDVEQEKQDTGTDEKEEEELKMVVEQGVGETSEVGVDGDSSVPVSKRKKTH